MFAVSTDSSALLQKPILIPLIQPRSLDILDVRESGSDRKSFHSEWIELSGAHMYDSDCSDESDESDELKMKMRLSFVMGAITGRYELMRAHV